MASVPLLRQARRSAILLIGAGLLALGGCEVPRQQAPAVRPAPPPEPPMPRVTDGRNNVALLVPLVGTGGGVGRSIANAANLALLDSGSTTIRLTVYNTAEEGAAAAARRALEDGVGLILGPLLAEDVRAVAPLANRARVPVIAFSNDSTVAGNGVFLLGTVPAQAIDRVVTFARGKGVTRFAGLVPAGLYGQRSAQALTGAVEESGGQLTAVQTFTRTPAGLRTAVRAVRAKGRFEAVLIADTGRMAAVAAPLVKQGARSTRILGTELWGTEERIGATPALRGSWYAAVPNAAFRQLVSRYRKRYGKIPYRLGSLGYDSMLLTVRASRNWDLGRRFPTRLLSGREGFAGVDGIFRFERDGIARRALEVRQVTARGSTLLSPAPRKFED